MTPKNSGLAETLIEFFKCLKLAHFSTDFDDTCIKTHGS